MSLVETRRRIQTINATSKITKAMKLVASVKFQKWKRYYDDNLDYSLAVHDVMVRTLQSISQKERDRLPSLKVYSNTKNLYILVTSSLGLCGSYNYNLFKALDPILKDDDELLLIGQKGYLHYKDNKYKLIIDYVNLMDNFTYDNVKQLRHYFFRLYKTKKYKSVTLVYTDYKNSFNFHPTFRRILPFDLKDEGINLETNDRPIFDPNAREVLKLILPHYIDSSIYNKLLSSEISELSSRRNAMETATDSAFKILDQLKLEYNKARQQSITQELTEIIAGSFNK